MTRPMSAAKPRHHCDAGELASVLHYVPTASIRARTEAFALCGAYIPKVRPTGNGTGDMDMCPMCTLEYETLETDPDAYNERHLYGDSGDPLREATRMCALAAFELHHKPISEAAAFAGESVQELYAHMLDGRLSARELEAVADMSGYSLQDFVQGIDDIRRQRACNSDGMEE